jgi:hypothetical protein
MRLTNLQVSALSSPSTAMASFDLALVDCSVS